MWTGESLSHWQQSLEAEMADERPAIVSEPQRDRWMSARAWETIEEQPVLFLRSCLTRLLRFWNPVPLNTPDRPVSVFLALGVGIFSAGLFAGVIASAVRFRITALPHEGDWLTRCAWCLIISMTLVHLIYWSNIRMRTPLEPFLALLVIGGFGRFCTGDEVEAPGRQS